jgi:hypothetical protein
MLCRFPFELHLEFGDDFFGLWCHVKLLVDASVSEKRFFLFIFVAYFGKRPQEPCLLPLPPLRPTNSHQYSVLQHFFSKHEKKIHYDVADRKIAFVCYSNFCKSAERYRHMGVAIRSKL